MLASKEKILLWRGSEAKEYEIRPETKRLLGQNFLYHLLRFDPSSFYLAISTLEDRQYTYSELKERIALYLNKDLDNIGVEASKSIDTLLDSGVFKAEWGDTADSTRRLFSNRGELLDCLLEIEQKSTLPLVNENFASNLKDVYKLIFEENPPELIQKLEEIENRLADFITTAAKKAKEEKNCDAIVPVMRKGYMLFRHLLDKKRINLHGLTEYDVFSLKLGKIKDKRPLILDDACNKGVTIERNLAVMESLKMENYAFAAFCVNKDFIREDIRKRITYCPNEYDDFNFHKEVLNIVLYIASLGEISDYDHLFIRCEFDDASDPSVIYRSLSNLGMGRITEPDLDHLHPTRKKITIDEVKCDRIYYERGLNLPHCVLGFDTQKVRLTFERDITFEDRYLVKRFVVVPIVNPMLERSYADQEDCGIEGRAICGLIKKEHLAKIYRRIPPHPCIDCIIYDIVETLGKYFLEAFASTLAKEGLKFKVTDVRFEYMRRKYDQFDKKLSQLKRELEKDHPA